MKNIVTASLAWRLAATLAEAWVSSRLRRLCVSAEGLAQRTWQPVRSARAALRLAFAQSILSRLTALPEETDDPPLPVWYGSRLGAWIGRFRSRRKGRGAAEWRHSRMVSFVTLRGSPHGRVNAVGWTLVIAIGVNTVLVLASPGALSGWGIYTRVLLLLIGLVCTRWRGDATPLLEQSTAWRWLTGRSGASES